MKTARRTCKKLSYEDCSKKPQCRYIRENRGKQRKYCRRSTQRLSKRLNRFSQKIRFAFR